MLSKLSMAIQTQVLACNNNQFSGNGSKVIGPLSLPNGSYKVVAKTSDYMIAEATIVDANCPGKTSPDLSLNKDSSSQEEEAILTIGSQCPIVLDITNNSKPWLLELQSMK